MLGGTTSSRILALASLALTVSALSLLPDRAAAASSGWQVVLDRPTPNFGAVDFVSDSEGWVPAGAGLLHTTDGGSTWTENAKLTVNDVDFFDQQHGWAVGPNAAIFYTSDGGLSWEQQDGGLSDTTSSAYYIQDVEVVSAVEAWAIALYDFSDVPQWVDSVVLHTTDAGATWQRANMPAGSQFHEVQFAGASGWLFGRVCDSSCYSPGAIHDYLLRTTDGGVSWSPAENVPDGAVSVDFIDEQHGWLTSTTCIGSDCSLGINTYKIHRTVDGGQTWSSTDVTALGGLPSVSFEDPLRGWGVSAECGQLDNNCTRYVIATEDGGATWRLVSTMLGSRFEHARSLNAERGRLYLSSKYHAALRSSDGGVTWEDMRTPALAIGAFDFIDRETGFALDGTSAMTTSDAGRTWERRGTVESFGRLQEMQFFDDSHGAVVFEGCSPDCGVELFKSADGGRTWSNAVTLPHEGAFEFKTLQVGDSGAAIAAAYRGLTVTTDYGQTWGEPTVPPEDGYVVNGAEMLDPAHLWVDSYPEAGGPSVLVFSSDAGRTWHEVYRGLPLGDIEFFDAQHGWARAFEDYYRTADGGQTWKKVPVPASNRLFDVTFIDPNDGWASGPSGEEGPSSYRVFHTADGGVTWTEQTFDAPEHAVAVGLEFVDPQRGWFTITPSCAFGVGCGLFQYRTVLYHTTDGGGGPIGELPDDLPDVGAGPVDRTPASLPMLLLAATGLAALAASLALRRRRII